MSPKSFIAWPRRLPVLACACILACSHGEPTGTVPDLPPGTVALTTLGRGDFRPGRVTGEIAVRGTTAYTTTWGNAGPSSVFHVWDVTADVPRLVDSVTVTNATTLGDVAVSDDGQLLIVATERSGGSIVIYQLADPRHPAFLSRYGTANTAPGVHTAEIARVNGTLYGFLCVDPGNGIPARLVIVDLSDPLAPREVFTQSIGRPFVHDTFVRDGLLFLGLWNDGVAIWDIGGGGRGGSPAAPVPISRLVTANGEVHNMWWVDDPSTGSRRYLLVGEEGPADIGRSSSGDIHVVDVANLAAPREVAFYTVAGAGTHNFSVDEARGVLYAAYYNGGVRAIDVRGDLGGCTPDQRSTPANSTEPLCDLRKMGRELGVGLLESGNPVYVWGVQYTGDAVYASDMLNGIWKLRPLARP